jgi:hypothetical protein
MICGRYSTPTVIKSTYIRINVRLNVRKPANIWNEFISVAQIVRWCYHASRTVISATSKLGPWRPLRSLLGLAACAFGGEVGFRPYDVSPYPSLEFIHSPVRDCSRRWNWFCVPGSAIYRGGSGLFHPLVSPSARIYQAAIRQNLWIRVCILCLVCFVIYFLTYNLN